MNIFGCLLARERERERENKTKAYPSREWAREIDSKRVKTSDTEESEPKKVNKRQIQQ